MSAGTALASRFDWYEMTFDGWDDSAHSLALSLHGDLARGKGRNGYAQCLTVSRGSNELARVYGHSSRVGEVHVVTSGTSCDEVVPVLRTLWPSHRVSRADSSVDFEADFDELDAFAVSYAKRKGLSHRLVTDSDGGATRYLGAPSSEFRVRLYKKTEQLRALTPERASEIPEGICRAECQARPGKRDAKASAASLSPDDVWGLSGWGQDFAGELLDLDVRRTETHWWRSSDWSRALFYLGQQYGPLIRQRAGEVGSDAVLAELVDAFQL